MATHYLPSSSSSYNVSSVVDLHQAISVVAANVTTLDQPSSHPFLKSYITLLAYFMGVGNNTKCFGPLGCIDINEDWYGLSRPVNVLPEDREVINTQFILWTPSTIQELEIINASEPSSIGESAFDPSRPTKIIIHGFIDTGFVPWIKEMALGLLANGAFNVIAADWGGGSASLYSQAAANTRLVGLEVAYLVERLVVDFSASVSDFHLIGHSLGSHIAGYAGERLLDRRIGRLGRISALDPADPLFQSMPKMVRLDPGDAAFVDAVHTDANSILMFGYGMAQPVGHVDFYPNGGSNQPGCTLMDLPGVNLTSMVNTADSVGRHLVACSHTRAIQLYIESLRTNQSCQMIGQECSSYEEYKKGSCFSCGSNNEHCAPLGYRAIEYKKTLETIGGENVKMFLNTGKNPTSFCHYHYLLKLNLAQPRESERWVQGFLKANLYGTNKEVLELDLSNDKSVRISHGGQKSFLLTFPSDLGRLSLVHVHWTYDHELDPLNLVKVCVLLCSDRLFVRSLQVQRLQDLAGENFVEICGDSSNGISEVRSGEWKLFYKKCHN